MGYSAFFSSTATVTNGSRTNATAALANGIKLGAAGRVTNFGSIGSPSYTKFTNSGSYYSYPGAAVDFTQAGSTLVEEGTGSITGKVIGGGGTLILAGDAGAGTIGGIGTTITGFASIEVAPNASWTITGAATIAASTTFETDGTASFTGQATNHGTIIDKAVLDRGSSGQIVNAADGTLVFEGNSSVTEASGATGFGLVDYGLIKRSGAGTTTIGAITNLTSSAKVEITSGSLKFASRNTTIAGSVYGAGSLVFGTGRATLASGASITAAGLQITGASAQVVVDTTLSYSHTFNATTGTELTVNTGDTFTLAGPTTLSGLKIDGNGRLNLRGASSLSSVTLGGREVVTNASTVTEASTTTLGAAARLVNASGATFALAGNGGIAGTGPFTNAGLLVKTTGTARSIVGTAITNVGIVEARTGTIAFTAAVGGSGGTLQIDNGAGLEFDSTVAKGQTVSFNGVNGNLLLKAASGFAATIAGFASGDTVDLRGFRTSGETLNYTQNAAGTGGILTVKSGTNTASLTFSGQYDAAGFHIAADSAGGGTNLTYSAPQVTAATHDSLTHALFDAALGGGTSGAVADHAPISTPPPILWAAPAHMALLPDVTPAR